MTGYTQYDNLVPVRKDRFTFLFVILQKSWDDKSTIHGDKGVQYTGTGVEKPLIPTLTTL